MRRSVAALGALAAVTAGMALATPSAQAADPAAAGGSTGSSAGTDPGSRERAFAAAAAEYGVPRTVLEAVSYAQTRWDFNPGHSTSGGYGPMHLVAAQLGSAAEGKGLGEPPSAASSPAADTLGKAATLTGLSEDALRTDELANIRGGAALLAADAEAPRPADVERPATPVPGSRRSPMRPARPRRTSRTPSPRTPTPSSPRAPLAGRSTASRSRSSPRASGRSRPRSSGSDCSRSRTAGPSTARPGSTASGSPRPTRSWAPTRATTATTTSRAARPRRRSRTSSSTTRRRPTTRRSSS